MDLYYAMTNYQLLECIFYKLNNNNPATIYISSYLLDNSPFIVDKVKESGFFDHVLVYEEVIFSHEKKLNIEKEIDRISKKTDIKYGKAIRKAKNIYVGQDVDSFGVFLVHNGIKYHFFEDANGAFANSQLLFSIVKKENKNRLDIINKLKLYGGSKYVIDILCNFDAQKKEVLTSKCRDFSVTRELGKINKDDLSKILKIFGGEHFCLEKKKKDLLLTWHYNNMGFMTLEEQRRFFATLVDYFTEEDEILFIKPHPSDKQPDYKEWFKDAIVLDRCMPSELLPYCIDDKFDKGITNWSTSIYGLQGVLKKIINFDKMIDDTYADFDKYLAIVKYLEKIKDKNNKQRIVLDGTNGVQLSQLMNYYFTTNKKYYDFVDEDGDIYIVDKFSEELRGQKVIALEDNGGYEYGYCIETKTSVDNKIVYLYNLPYVELHFERKLKYSNDTLEINLRSLSEYIKSLKNKIDFYKNQAEAYHQEICGLLSSKSWKMTEPFRRISEIRRKNGKK